MQELVTDSSKGEAGSVRPREKQRVVRGSQPQSCCELQKREGAEGTETSVARPLLLSPDLPRSSLPAPQGQRAIRSL